MLHRDLQAETVPVRKVMARGSPRLEATALLEEVYRILMAGNSAVLITRHERLVGLITRANLLEFYKRYGSTGEESSWTAKLHT